MSELPTWFSAAELAAMALPDFPSTERGVAKRLQTDDRRRPDKQGLWWRSRQASGGGIEYNLKVLPRAAQHALLQHVRGRAEATAPVIDTRAGLDRDVAWVRFNRLSDKQREKAKVRLQAVVAVVDRKAQGWPMDVAVASAATEFKASKASLYVWMTRVQGVDRADWIAHLIDAHVGVGKTAECSADAWEMFKADYLRPAKPSAESCYRRLQRIAAAKGWTVPSLKTLKRRIEAIPLAVRVERREGAKALKAMYPAQQRDRSVFHAMEAVCADGHKLDVFVRWPDGSVGRPELLGFQDLYSGMILSWRVDISENKEMVRLAFGDLVEEFGIPEHCFLDNGRAFASKWISGGAKSRFRFKAKQDDPQGVMETLGVSVHFVSPYSGQSKPIERAWRDFADNIARHPAFAGAYTGANTQAKPSDYGTRAIPLDELERVIGAEVIEHNNRVGRKTRVCGGTLSFRQAFDASYSKSLIRKASPAQRQFLLLMAEVLTVRQPDASLHLLGNRYWSEGLLEFMGKRVTVRFDPQRLHESLKVYTLDGRMIGEAACIEAVGFNDVAAAQEHSRRRRAWMRAQREVSELERGMTIAECAQLLEQVENLPPPAPETKIVRLVTPGGALRQLAVAPEEIADDGLSETDRKFLRGHAAHMRQLRLVENETTDV